MNKIEEYIRNIYSELQADEKQPISETSIRDAIRYIDAFNLKDSNDLFVVLAALNLLSANAKNGKLKTTLYYSYIKSNVGKVAEHVITHEKDFEDTYVYYDKTQRCFYFSIFGVVFSFHYIKETDKINEAANNNPIVWPGIRLQRIAQTIFLYSIKMVEESNSTKLISDSNMSEENTNYNLSPCPECGKLISKKAKNCPHCGFDMSNDDEIAKDVTIGDQIQVETNGVVKTGIVQTKGNNYIGLALSDGTIYRIRYNSISSILMVSQNGIDVDIISTQIIDEVKDILEKEDINLNSKIETNSTIKKISSGHIYAVTDGGKSVYCIAPIGFSTKRTKIEDRLFCMEVSAKDSRFIPIIEMPYFDLCGRLTKSISNVRKNARSIQYSNSIISYLYQIARKDESKKTLLQIKNKIRILSLSISSSDNTNRVLQDGNKGNRMDEDLTIKPDLPNAKPSIIENASSNKVLSDDLPVMSELDCRHLERELDVLIREGKREECLSKSYEIISTKKPTTKYLRSYLDRIVNTEIALEHMEQAKDALAILIAFSEKQSDTKPNNLSHLYISLARLLVSLGNNKDAKLALDWAEYTYPKNQKIVSKIRQSLEAKEIRNNADSVGKTTPEDLTIKQDIVVSRMLIQDVEQYAKTQVSLDEEESSPLELFNTAEIASSDKTKSYEFRAQMYLDAAAAYFNAGLLSKKEFYLAVANYARMKGNSLMAKITESVQQYPDSQSHLIAECDSARSYYLEALGLYNDLNQRRYVQRLLLKYLKIESLASQVEGGKTPDTEWHKGTLKEKMQECLFDYNIESRKVLFRTCIAIGSSSERTWNALASDEDGIGPLYGKLGGDIKYRGNAYEIINKMEKSSVDTSYAPGEFLRKIFEARQIRIRKLKTSIENCLSWEFNPFDLASFDVIWSSIDEYKDLMTTTDRQTIGSINDVITILKPYAGRKENERYRNLVSSQQILMKSQRLVTETTTYYGRVFFSHLQEKWMKRISHQIEEREASTLPQLSISPEPCYIKKNDNGQGIIDFVVTNNGDSTAQSFVVRATINGKEYVVSHDDELPAGDSCGECIMSNELGRVESADVLFSLIAKYQGRDLPTKETEATYEVECGDVLTDDVQIPWKIGKTPQETLFKGREEKLTKLISHYLSKERYMTYILYGLTRTGKTSIVDYLCERIDGKHINEDEVKIIKSFKWTFDEKEYKNIKRSDLWANLLETRIYDELSDELASAVNAAYPEQELPPADKLSQSDLEVVIEALNCCNIIPFIAIDEFSYVRKFFERGVLDNTFLKKLRDISYSGKACFLYAGTYDIKDIPKEYGLTGEMNNTYAMPINEIGKEYANELIDVCPNLIFDEKAKDLIRALSGCVPYWIQWICLNCGKYAVAQKRRHLGYNEVNYVVEVMTGEIQQGKKDTWQAIDEMNFHNNQIDPNNVAEHQLISSIAYLIRESTHIERGVSMDELNRLWGKFNVDEIVRKNMVRALTGLVERQIVKQFTDETREVYRLNVDLFRRWWYVHHRDIQREFNS